MFSFCVLFILSTGQRGKVEFAPYVLEKVFLIINIEIYYALLHTIQLFKLFKRTPNYSDLAKQYMM